MKAYSKTKGVKPNQQKALADALDFINNYLHINNHQLRTQHSLDNHILSDIQRRECSINSFDTYAGILLRILYRHRALYGVTSVRYKDIDNAIRLFSLALFDIPVDKIVKYRL